MCSLYPNFRRILFEAKLIRRSSKAFQPAFLGLLVGKTCFGRLQLFSPVPVGSIAAGATLSEVQARLEGECRRLWWGEHDFFMLVTRSKTWMIPSSNYGENVHKAFWPNEFSNKNYETHLPSKKHVFFFLSF